MDSSYMTNPVVFLIDTLFSLYILAVLLRLLLQWTHAEFYNPISQFLVTITHPPLKYLRRFVPSAGNIDSSSILLAMALQMLADFIILLLKGISISIGGLALLSFGQLLSMLLNIFIFAIFARAILSWITPGAYSAATSLLFSLTEPLLSTCRKMIPPFAGMDWSPLIALIALQVAKMLILPPLQQLTMLIS
ncbi:MAG: YggT family protein [Gammaproteobacteria bacterium]